MRTGRIRTAVARFLSSHSYCTDGHGHARDRQPSRAFNC
jgi:hypothetical protein